MKRKEEKKEEEEERRNRLAETAGKNICAAQQMLFFCKSGVITKTGQRDEARDVWPCRPRGGRGSSKKTKQTYMSVKYKHHLREMAGLTMRRSIIIRLM